MQRQTLIAIASLALLYGCGGKNKEVAASAPAPATVAVPATAAALTPPSTTQSQPDAAKPLAVAAVHDLKTGEKVYKSTCSICHKTGLKGAPRLGKKDEWESRLARGNEVLYDHAINGYTGKKGTMPSRGSNARLTEEEVKAAVDYMTTHAIPSFTMDR